MASRRDLLERRPSSRPTTRRSFGSTLRAQLSDREKPSTPDGSPKRPAAQPLRSVLKKPVEFEPLPPPISPKRAHVESMREETSSESEEPIPKRSRAALPEDERLVREQDTEYQEELHKTKTKSTAGSKKQRSERKDRHQKVSTMDVVLTAVMKQVEEFIIEDLSRDGRAVGAFREELATAMAEESHALEEGSALRADSARLTREKKKLRTEILHTKEMRATSQVRIGQLSAQAAKLRTLVHQLEAFHGLVSDVSELQEICESNTAAGVPPSKTAQERSLSLSVPHLLAMLHETTHNVEYLRGINATLAKCLERLDEQ